MKKKSRTHIIYALTLALAPAFPLPAQETAADTTALGYKVGYQIGSWLPFLVIITLAVLIILKMARQNQE